MREACLQSWTKAIRIAHVIRACELGGAEKIALELASRQRALGYDARVVCLAPLGKSSLVQEFAIRTVPLDVVVKRPGFDLSLIPRLQNYFLARRVSIVHTHNPQPMVYGAPAGKLAGACVIHTKHGVNPDLSRRVLLRKWAAKLVDGYVAVSMHTADEARLSERISNKRLRVIENGVDADLFRPRDNRSAIRQEMGIGNGPVIGTVGRLSRVKNQALLLRASAPLLTTDAILCIAGDGPERSDLEAVARELNIADKVIFLGERSDIHLVLAAFDVFALSSDTEGLPLAVLEAMASGLPVVSTNVGGIPAVVSDGQTGFLTRPGDEEALRSRLLLFLSDTELANRCGHNAREKVIRDYSMEKTAREHLEFYWESMDALRLFQSPLFQA